MIVRFLLALSIATSLYAAEPTLEVLSSYPANQAYTVPDAPRTQTWIRFRSTAFQNLRPGERLKVWVQWAPALEGPWKVHSKGEVEVRSAPLSSKKMEHPRLKTRGNLTKIVTNDDEGTAEMGPLSYLNWDRDSRPFFRLAQAIRKSGTQWNKSPKRSPTPEDNEGIFSAPFQAELDIVFAYLPKANLQEGRTLKWNNTHIYPDQPGPWSAPSFQQGPLSYVSFFIGLGGINYGAVVPSHPFNTTGPAGKLLFWSCKNKPKGYRGSPVDQSSLDALWWGVCPVRVPLPSLGETTTLTVTTMLHDQEYTKTFTIHGFRATPERLAERKINQTRYKLLSDRLQGIQAKTGAEEEALQAVSSAKEAYRDELERYKEEGDSEAAALADAYIAFLESEQGAYLAHRAHIAESSEAQFQAKLRDHIAAAKLAEELQDWPAMKGHLNAYLDLVTSAAAGLEKTAELVYKIYNTYPLEPFGEGSRTASFYQLLKAWAWIMSDPQTYLQAIELKKGLLKGRTNIPHSIDDDVSPQEYRELAELIMERTGDRIQAEDFWRKADQLLIDADSPFHNLKADESRLKMQRPGWWPN